MCSPDAQIEAGDRVCALVGAYQGEVGTALRVVTSRDEGRTSRRALVRFPAGGADYLDVSELEKVEEGENEGRGEARAVIWEYRVTEKAAGRVTARRFRSELRLKPGARAELKAFSYEQPSGVVSAESGGKRRRVAFGEAVVIVRVEYTDGGAWEAK